MRLLPHDQNTGGFFVCVLEKEAAPAETSSTKRAASPSTLEGAPDGKKTRADETEVAIDETAVVASEPKDAAGEVTEPVVAAKKEKKDWSYKEDPFSFVDAANPELDSIW
jgi:multisite-specific tRNA:(cytosine-C5)-methyltransferase